MSGDLKDTFMEGPTRPSRLRVLPERQRHCRRFPDERSGYPGCLTIASHKGPRRWRGYSPKSASIRPKIGMSKSRAFAMVVCLGKRETIKIESRYETWLHTITEERMVRTSGEMSHLIRGITEPAEGKKPSVKSAVQALKGSRSVFGEKKGDEIKRCKKTTNPSVK